jgi:hypothetical protein
MAPHCWGPSLQESSSRRWRRRSSDTLRRARLTAGGTECVQRSLPSRCRAWHSLSPAARRERPARRRLARRPSAVPSEDQWATALIKRDAAFFRRTLHPDYVRPTSAARSPRTGHRRANRYRHCAVRRERGMRAPARIRRCGDGDACTVRGRGPKGSLLASLSLHRHLAPARCQVGMIASQDYEIPAR